MAQNQAPGFEKETELWEVEDKFHNRGYWGYHEGEEGEAGEGEQGHGTVTGMGCGGGG